MNYLIWSVRIMSDAWPKSYQELISFTQRTKNSRYVSKENHREHIAVNRDKDFIYHIKIDGDVIPKTCADTKRIDFLLLNETKKVAYFIELKGCHIEDAFAQLEISHEHLQPLLTEYAINWRLVHRSRTSDLKTNKVNKYLRKHPQLKIHDTPMEETI